MNPADNAEVRNFPQTCVGFVSDSSISTMTRTTTFEYQFRAAMKALESGLPPRTPIFVSSIPNIYRLWSVLRSNPIAEVVWYGAKICKSMLSPFNTEDDRQTAEDVLRCLPGISTVGAGRLLAQYRALTPASAFARRLMPSG